MRILVTGAAGYIGSVVTELLVESGHEVWALDNLQHGHRQAVHPKAHFVALDLRDGASLRELLQALRPEAVVHLAAEALIDVSIRDPGRFYAANVCGGLNLLEAMRIAGTERLVFSSTAAVYGEPERVPIPEEAPLRPINAYGESKLAFERMLPWYRRAFGLRYVVLRYFNACGATERYGEYHVPETHLIPILFEVALRLRPFVSVYGTDYETPDGTCIRDYIHVVDIARAHLLALEHLDRLEAAIYNLGNGNGYSNLEVIRTVEYVTGRPIPWEPAPRRPGDPARLIASAERIRRELGWEPLYPDLERMVASAWSWRVRHPRGYAP